MVASPIDLLRPLIVAAGPLAEQAWIVLTLECDSQRLTICECDQFPVRADTF